MMWILRNHGLVKFLFSTITGAIVFLVVATWVFKDKYDEYQEAISFYRKLDTCKDAEKADTVCTKISQSFKQLSSIDGFNEVSMTVLSENQERLLSESQDSVSVIKRKYEFTLEQEGLLIAVGTASGSRDKPQDPKATGMLSTIVLDNSTCGSSLAFEAQAETVTFPVQATCVRKIGIGEHEIVFRATPVQTNSNVLDIVYYVLPIKSSENI